MEICNLVHNSTIPNTSFTWGQVFNETVHILNATSYLRPDKGITLIPWAFIILLLVLHIPMVIIRVVKWETIQVWCLVSALFTILVYVQAYISTRFSPDKVLIWNPVILIIDSGSMLQVFVLVVEESRFFSRLLDTPTRQIWRIRVVAQSYIMHSKRKVEQCDIELPNSDNESSHSNQEDNGPSHGNHEENRSSRGNHEDNRSSYGNYEDNRSSHGNYEDNRSSHCNREDNESIHNDHTDSYPPILRDIAFYRALAAVALLLAIFILQVLGIRAASRHRKSNAEPLVSYCSPGFQPFAKAVLDSNCRIYGVNQSAGKGIGCISIPGRWQRDWLGWTAIGTPIAIVLQFIDFLVLCSVNSGTRWRAVKMRRPWLTMFAGLAFLGATLFFSLDYATNLPPGISEQVWAVMDTGADKPVIYSAHLTTAGLRGQVIAWFDGLLDSWGSTYYGDSV